MRFQLKWVGIEKLDPMDSRLQRISSNIIDHVSEWLKTTWPLTKYPQAQQPHGTLGHIYHPDVDMSL